jgi:hypothetical protein
MDGDAERSGVTEGLAKVSEVAGTEAAGTGLAKRPGADGRAGNVPPGGKARDSEAPCESCRRICRSVPNRGTDRGLRHSGGRCSLGPLACPAARSYGRWIRRLGRSSSFSSASCSAANCRFTSHSISACISASVTCFWQEQTMARP